LEGRVTDSIFPLDALHEARNWSIWILGISGALSTTAGFIAVRSAVDRRHRRDAKIAIFFGSIAIVCAIVMISRIPVLITELPLKHRDDVELLILFMKIPRWIYDVAMQVSTIVAGFFILSIAWRTAFGNSFIDFGILSAARQAELRQEKSKLNDLTQKKEMLKLSKDATELKKKLSKLQSDISTLKERV
jgi:uncharacterized membrane protein